MATNLDVQKSSPPTRRLADWFDVDLPDVFRWFEERRPGLLSGGDRIRVEEEVSDGVLHIRAEAPGIDPEKDAQVSVEDGVLRLHVERRQESRSEEEGRVRSEFHYGSFYRAIPLPKGVDQSQVSASYKDGILEITVPMPQPAQAESQKVNISRN
jgi:HSP20 family protein